MEEDIKHSSLRSAILHKKSIQSEIEKLKNAIEQASEILDFETAHDPEILYAIDIIENFLRTKKRVCYGGTAINAILPNTLRFYDMEKELPDYDFFSPSPEDDLALLVKQLQQAGFREVTERVGIHEGTHKLLVNFVPIADITHMDRDMYDIVFDRALRKDGIYYSDPDFLRMNMYLELSRPRGQVARWDKVYERLLLLNFAFPMKTQHCKHIPRTPSIPTYIREKLLDFILEKNRILIGAEVATVYSSSLTKRSFNPTIQWFIKKGGPILFMSSQILQDSLEIRTLFGKNQTEVEVIKGFSEVVPDRVLIKIKNTVVAMIVEEQACHSYNTIHLRENKKLYIGSIDTLITFYLAMYIFTDNKENTAHSFGYSIACLCEKLIDISSKLRKKEHSHFPAFSITCSGYQKGFSTLLREKAARILKMKKKNATRRKTKSRKIHSRHDTRRNLH